MKPSEQAPSSVILEGLPEVNHAKWVTDVYGEDGLRGELQNSYAHAITPVAQAAGVYPEYEHIQVAAGIGGPRKTREAQAMSRAEDSLPVELSPEVSKGLLDALHKQAEVRGMSKVKHAITHPLATVGATQLRRSYQASSFKLKN